MEVEVKLPKPGDQLPFVVAEWEGHGYRYHAGYDSLGNAFANGKKSDYAGPYDIPISGPGIWAIFAMLGAPMSVKSISTVATTIEGGEE